MAEAQPDKSADVTPAARPPREPAARFHPLFERWARRVRSRLFLRHVLSGVTWGAVATAAAATLAWRLRHGDLRLAALGLAAVGLAVGAALARKRRWSDVDVALYLDDRLETDETIATAVEMRNEAELDDSARAVVVSTAALALAEGDAKRARPRVTRVQHLLLPLAFAAVAFVVHAPLPAAPFVATPPGTTTIQDANVDGLAKIAKLAQLSARDDAQRQRLDQIAKDAEKLREDLAKGMEKREAQDRIARLQDALSEERLSLGSGQERSGLESAVSTLQQSEGTKQAGDALGDHDLERMDHEMERIANEREKSDRDLAKQKLDEAAEAARKGGAPGVAKALESQKKALEEREKRAAALRDLADAMKGTGEGGGEVGTKSEALDREKSDAAAKQLAESMGKALEKLTPEERKRLAEKLREMAKEQQRGGAAADADRMKDLADQLGTPEGQKQLEDRLKDLAKEDASSDEAKRQQGLDDAQRGGEDAQGDVGQQGQGQQGQGQQGQGQQGQGQQGQGQQGQGQQGQGQQGQGQQGQGQQGQGQGQGLEGIPLPGEGSGQGGSSHGSHDQGTGGHGGATGGVAGAGTIKSRAHGPLGNAAAMPGWNTSYTTGKAGGTANARGTGDLRVVGPGEVDGVERSDVPEEYREQVRQYFQP